LLLLVLALGALATGAWWITRDSRPEPQPRSEPPATTREGPARPLPKTRPALGQQPGAVSPVDSWARVNERGLAALEREDYGEAIEAFEACLAGDPDEPVFARNLAEALVRQATRTHAGGDAAQRLAAIAMLERAAGLAPDREALSELLVRWKRSAAAEDGFYEQGTEHFDVAYDLDRNEVRAEIDQVCRLLEDAYIDCGEAFGFWPVESGRPRVRVVLYTREGFDRVTGVGPWAGGVYDGTIRVPVGDLTRELPAVVRVLRHELLHAFVEESGGHAVPAWLNEGLAQWMEESSSSARQAAVDRARATLSGAELFTLDELAGNLATWEDAAAIERAYAQALAFVAYAERQYGATVLFAMVTGCREGTSAEDSFRARIGIPLSAVLEDLASEL